LAEALEYFWPGGQAEVAGRGRQEELLHWKPMQIPEPQRSLLAVAQSKAAEAATMRVSKTAQCRLDVLFIVLN
jgi:hypothetical protein